jgi:hypothetical protein
VVGFFGFLIVMTEEAGKDEVERGFCSRVEATFPRNNEESGSSRLATDEIGAGRLGDEARSEREKCERLGERRVGLQWRLLIDEIPGPSRSRSPVPFPPKAS